MAITAISGALSAIVALLAIHGHMPAAIVFAVVGATLIALTYP